MLFVNGELKTIDEVIEVVNRAKKTTYTRAKLASLFRNNAMYKINPITQAIDLGESNRRNSPVQKTVRGTDVLARFTFFCEVDGTQKEIRYADSQPYPDKNGVRIYKPKGIDLAGPNHTVDDAHGKSLDRMLYIFLHPHHAKSPFHTPGSVYRYTHINNDELFEERAATNNLTVEALQHATNLNGLDAVIFAKSLGLQVQGLTPSQVQTQLQTYLLAGGENVTKYQKHMNDQSEIFIGRVIDAIDNRHIVSQSVNGGTVWSFNLSGNQNQIVTVEMGTDMREGLINHIKSHIAEYAPIIQGIARENLKDFEFKEYFNKMENASEGLEYKKEGDDLLVADISTHAEAKKYYENYFNRTTSGPTTVKAFLEAIQSGVITDENVGEAILEFAPKS